MVSMETTYQGGVGGSGGEMVTVDLNGASPANLAKLQMVLVTSSMNHEYIRQAYDQERSFHKRQELLSRMSELKSLYFQVRKSLELATPDKLEEIETDLLFQKQTVLNEYPI